MIGTEKEAGEWWCPMVRWVPYDYYTVSNRFDDATAFRCIASKCAAWRWDMAWDSSTEEGHGGDIIVRLKRKQGEPKRGYCGLSGRLE